MDISLVWEHNGPDTLLYAIDLPGAFTRGESFYHALDKLPGAVRGYLRWMGRETPEEIMEGWMSMARSAYAHTLPLKPGVPAFLDACRRRGTRMAVLTSCMPPLCRAALEHHRLLDCFEAVYTTAELGIEKRDPALYCLAAERSGVPPQSCLLFEDSPSYCAAARQAGFTVVGVFDPLFAPRWGEMEALCHHRLERFADASPTLWQIP